MAKKSPLQPGLFRKLPNSTHSVLSNILEIKKKKEENNEIYQRKKVSDKRNITFYIGSGRLSNQSRHIFLMEMFQADK